MALGEVTFIYLFACENKDSVDRVIFSPDQKWARDEALELAKISCLKFQKLHHIKVITVIPRYETKWVSASDHEINIFKLFTKFWEKCERIHCSFGQKI